MLTRRARDNSKFTEFGLWMKNQRNLGTNLGYIASNLDYVWLNNRTQELMLIEEKREMKYMTPAQKDTFYRIHKMLEESYEDYYGGEYKGFFFIQFSRKSPKDGRIFLNGRGPGGEITEQDLIEFLAFKKPEGWYQSYFDLVNYVPVYGEEPEYAKKARERLEKYGKY